VLLAASPPLAADAVVVLSSLLQPIASATVPKAIKIESARSQSFMSAVYTGISKRRGPRVLTVALDGDVSVRRGSKAEVLRNDAWRDYGASFAMNASLVPC
jgi:hypothetical protein